MFQNLVGNDRIKDVLHRMLKNKRIPGAMIFAGDEGIGKRLFAFELAKSKLCHDSQNFEACNRCSACQRVDKLDLPKSLDKDNNEKIFFTNHPDVGFIRPAGKFITVETIRDLQAEALVRPFEGSDKESGARFFIVDQSERMNEAAANALLKTLEEPPPSTHIILLTSRLNALLQTIRSRCQILRFALIDRDEIENYLNQSKKTSPNDVKLLARIAEGSLGKALLTNLELYKQQREQMLGVLESAAFSNDRARLLRIAEELNDAKLKDEYEERLSVLQNLIHDIWALRLGNENNLVNVDLQTKLVKLAENTESRQAQAWLAEIETLRENFAVNINRKIATDALFMKMVNA
jgi:DNA polymerase-3 subunit delta'